LKKFTTVVFLIFLLTTTSIGLLHTFSGIAEASRIVCSEPTMNCAGHAGQNCKNDTGCTCDWMGAFCAVDE